MPPRELAKPMTLLLGPLLNEKSLQRVQKLDKASFEKVILIDGASHFFKPPWPKNWKLIGDGDSSPAQMRKFFDQLLPIDKDQSDLSYVLHNLVPQHHRYLHAEGMSGGALDHELINLGELTFFLEERPSTEISWGPDLTAYSAGTHQLRFEGAFSLFSLKDQNIELLGDVKWPLQNHSLRTCSSRTLSNRAFGELQIKCEAPIFFYRQKKEKT